jgi:hypothetical protein
MCTHLCPPSASAPKAPPEESEEDSKGPYLSKSALARLLVEHVEGYAHIHSGTTTTGTAVVHTTPRILLTVIYVMYTTGVGSLSKASVCAKAAHALLHLRDHDPSQDTQVHFRLETHP